MIGAIVGDIVGSIYEGRPVQSKNFPFFQEQCRFTDDSMMTIAVAEAIMAGGTRDDFIDQMKRYGRLYPNAGYGGHFIIWLRSDSRDPYNSFGNGSAMRVSPCAWMMDCDEFSRTGRLPQIGTDLARLSAEVTHNHPEGIKGALATTDAIFLARYYFGGFHRGDEEPIHGDPDECKRRIRDHIESTYGYDLSLTVDQIRPTYSFHVSCQRCVPEAIRCFLDANSFEDAVRNAISLNGDSDTLAAIAGSIAEAAYGVPAWIEETALGFLDDRLIDVISRWRAFLNQ